MNLYHNQGKTYKNKKQFVLAVFHGASFFVLLALVLSVGLFAFWVYQSEKNVEISIENKDDIKRGDPVRLIFSTRMLKSSVEQGLKIEPALKIGTKWQSDEVLEIIPLETPHPDSSYAVKLSNFQSGWFISQKDFSFSFTTQDFPALAKVYPQKGQAGVDYYEHIVLDFDQPIDDEFKVEVSISPLSGFVHKLNDAKTQLVIEPKESLEKNTKYSLEAKVVHKEYQDEEVKIYEGDFATKQPPMVVYSFDSEGNPAKMEERKEEVLPKIKEGKSIQIDLSSQSLFIFENGKENGAFKVSTGLSGMDTPRGTFKVMAKARRPWSAKYKLYMPWFIQFTNNGHGIHELPEWPGGYKEGANHLGVPVSHGCVRLGVGPAKVVYDFAEVGVPIVVEW